MILFIKDDKVKDVLNNSKITISNGKLIIDDGIIVESIEIKKIEKILNV